MLLIWGQEDQLIHVSSAQVWQEGITDVETIIRAGIGHIPMAETPEKTADEVRRFLNAHQW